MLEVIFSPADFVASLNQTLEFAYPSVSIVGELANFRVSKNRWVYFDLKDEYASVKFFGTVYNLPGPLEDGLMLQVRGIPRLHPQYGFSVSIQSIQPVGEGSLKRAASLLEAKLAAEGLFEPARKRPLPFPPQRVGLITSKESAAYADFMKIINARWGGLEILLADVQVQGEPAVGQIVRAIEYFNSHAEPVDVLVLIRGGGSAEDLGAFSTEQVTRAVAGSRIPTLAAIGHEVDVTLAELAADLRASTPSNAAELLVPDKQSAISQLFTQEHQLTTYIDNLFLDQKSYIKESTKNLHELLNITLKEFNQKHKQNRVLLEALSPLTILKRGYAIVSLSDKLLRSAKMIKHGDKVNIKMSDGNFDAIVD